MVGSVLILPSRRSQPLALLSAPLVRFHSSLASLIALVPERHSEPSSVSGRSTDHRASAVCRTLADALSQRSWRCRQQSKTLGNAVYIGMTTDEAMEFRVRRQ